MVILKFIDLDGTILKLLQDVQSLEQVPFDYEEFDVQTPEWRSEFVADNEVWFLGDPSSPKAKVITITDMNYRSRWKVRVHENPLGASAINLEDALNRKLRGTLDDPMPIAAMRRGSVLEELEDAFYTTAQDRLAALEKKLGSLDIQIHRPNDRPMKVILIELKDKGELYVSHNVVLHVMQDDGQLLEIL